MGFAVNNYQTVECVCSKLVLILSLMSFQFRLLKFDETKTSSLPLNEHALSRVKDQSHGNWPSHVHHLNPNSTIFPSECQVFVLVTLHLCCFPPSFKVRS